MTYEYKGYTYTDNKKAMNLDNIVELIRSSYWANTRTEETIIKSMDNSICFGIFEGQKQVGFARVVSDFATMYWLCDVLVDENYKGQGLGKKLIELISDDERFRDLAGILATRDAHGLYEKYGFKVEDGKFMRRPRK